MNPEIHPADASNFSYEQLPSDLASEARKVAERVHRRNRAQIMETGNDLILMKKKLGHGMFGAWIEAEFGMSDRTAQNYMRAAETFADKPEIVSVLPPITVYALAAKSTPDDIRTDVIARFDAGQRLNAREIVARIDETRRTKQEESKRDARKRKVAKLPPEDQAKFEKAEARRARGQEAIEAEINRLREERERAAEDTALFLAERLGDDLPRFMEMLKASNVWDVVSALRSLDSKDNAAENAKDVALVE
ncbi:DUF3102 domain-containing protein [Methylobacterium nonmethylotrophicum]|nr:DUF3102 domain-containing protein [Methylobacterium nonmethylotrophicum]